MAHTMFLKFIFLSKHSSNDDHPPSIVQREIKWNCAINSVTKWDVNKNNKWWRHFKFYWKPCSFFLGKVGGGGAWMEAAMGAPDITKTPLLSTLAHKLAYKKPKQDLEGRTAWNLDVYDEPRDSNQLCLINFVSYL